MLSPPIKQRVRNSFDRAAPTYDGAAIVQRRVCERLIEQLSPASVPARILDAGCGTGYGARLLRQRWPGAHLTGLDFAPAMLQVAAPFIDTGLAADIEKLPLPDRHVDLWWSSLSIQWCDPATVFAEAFRVLTPGGHLAVSTLGPDTFHELRAAFAGVDAHRHTLAFDPPEKIGAALEAAGFGPLDLRRETHAVYYPDLKTLLRGVKAIGAHNVGEGGRSGMMGRAAWQQVEAAYERFRTAEGLPASYDVILATAPK